MDSRKWEIITTLLRLSHSVEAGLTRHLSPFGIALTDLRLMFMVLVLQGVSQKELAAQMGISQVVVSTRLAKLERAGLVARSHVGRRRVSIRHTEAGMNLLSVLPHSVLSSAPGRAIESLTETQVDQVLCSIRVLVSSMRVPIEQPLNLDQSPEAYQEYVGKEQEWLNHTLKSLENEIGMLVQAFRLLQAKQDQAGGGQLAQGSQSDGD